MVKIHYYILAYAVLLLNCQINCLAKSSASLVTDQSALLALKAHIIDDPYNILTRNWTNSSSICNWIGVTCTLRHNRVTALDISNMDLSGTIPPQLGNLSFLVSIDLSFNLFSGTLPQELSLLRRLKFISISHNNFMGEILPWFAFFPKLQTLSLSANSFSGEIPTEIGKLKSLQILTLGDNNLNGIIPQEIGNLQNLIAFTIEKNQIIGTVPPNIGNLTMLQVLSLSENNLTGAIPREIGQLYQLEQLQLGVNSFNIGSIPIELFNVSTLRRLSLRESGLSGGLPTNLGYGLPVLEVLNLDRNYLSGAIPDSISNCSNLRSLSLGSNEFTGFLPHSLGNLRLLQRLYLFDNNLRTESSSSELSFITSLTNCRFLYDLAIDGNPLDGVIPASVGNLSTSLQYFYAYNCKIKGSIPANIGNLSNLVKLSLYGNELSGNIPLTVKHLHKIQGLFLYNNNLGSPIPESLCDLHSLTELDLSQNQLSGSIPECLGNVTSLRHLHLQSNKLSSVPSRLWRLKDLLELDLSSNSLSGILPPDIGNLVAAVYINLSMNKLSGSISSAIGNLQDLVNLFLAHNRLEGPIPVSVGNMLSLVTLDISYNNLSGSIPKSLEALQYLDNFNVSFNALSGEIPTGGPFKNFTMESFMANKALCGIPRFHVPLCHLVTKHRSKKKKVKFALFILAGVVALITVVSLTFIFIRYRRKDKGSGRIDELVYAIPKRVSYYEILQATEQFNESNLLGIGSFGTVYRGVLRDGNIVAVKVFSLQSEVAPKSFDVECEVLRKIRHRNLTKVISSCSNEDFKALVLKYMPKGSLEKWLYSHNYCLDVMQRVNIMIDVASALEYLHHGYSPPIVHCDLKPSNVLLDEEMIGHVSDFGIAKLLRDGDSIVITNTLATLGYIAPEYGLEGIVSTRCDVYSYGVMLMETFTRRKPSDDMFAGDLSLKNWVESLLPQSSHQVIDANLLNPEDEHFDKILQCVTSILELALKCAAESPGDRINMKDALAELQQIKRRFSL